MARTQKISKKSSRIYRYLVATAFIGSGVFQFVAPVLAEGAKAGQSISNTATATYSDGTNTLNATSNTVTVTVAEVAGITITNSGKGFQASGDTNGDGKYNAGEKVYFDFVIKNTGNDPTRFNIPASPNVTNGTVDSLEIKYGTGAFGAFTGGNTSSVPADGTVTVRVNVTVANVTSGNVIATLGQTTTPGAQNIARENTTDTKDVYTVDNADGSVTDEVNGAPVNNGTNNGREASANDSLAINTTALFNGPNNQPEATYNGDNNLDFTNKSTPLTAAESVPGTKIDPGVVTFTNTVKNSGTATEDISLLPTPPATPGDLPNGTKVTITNGTQTAVYDYNSTTGFTFTSTGSTGTSATNPVKVNVVANGTSNYTVTVDLPANTDLSTDINRGYPVPISAFVDVGTTPNGVPDINEAKNITIDRVYTGFLKLVKLSRIVQGTGPAVGTGQGNFDSTPAVNGIDPNPGTPDVARTPAPGNIIEYRIAYTNISEKPQVGDTGNVVLNAQSVAITEDGNAGNNNWAKDNDSNGQIDTSHMMGSAKVETTPGDSSTPGTADGNATIAYTPSEQGTTAGNNVALTQTAANDVTKYVVTLTNNLVPQESRYFRFERKVSGTTTP